MNPGIFAATLVNRGDVSESRAACPWVEDCAGRSRGPGVEP